MTEIRLRELRIHAHCGRAVALRQLVLQAQAPVVATVLGDNRAHAA
ncbi:hypothetical protein OG738_09610 [Amycolatopsis sp. NBC_01488]|nr:hypothetical protein [Amycolatopsis sp. NBC_01488]